MARLVAQDPVFSRTDGSHLTRPQAMKRSLQKAAHMIKRVKELELNEEERYLFKQMVDDINFSDLHSYMFIPAIEGQGTDEQGREWLPKARAFEWIGCYAQTELGHGSNVQGLETTATYVPETDEWDVHTPTITATKWWPGGLGKASNHAVVYARLISKGKDHGVHAFLVPIRSLSDHKPLPGVAVGDIGPKFGNMGYNTMDNGFLAFSHVRIPRTNMLMRYAGVDRSGEYHRGSAAARQLAYGAIVFVRRSIVMESGIALGRAVTIAARYSCVRRQFGSSEGGAESKVMDYQTQQMRLLPLIASAYAFLFAGKWMAELYSDVVARIKRGDYSTLPEVHAATAGLKALTTAATAEGIEECRKLCGGHGYSLFSALPQLYAAFVPTCTYEGDNTVLLLQVARYLLKAVSQASEGKRPGGTAAYLGDANNLTAKCTADTASDFLQTPTQLAALQACAFHKAVAAATAVAAAPSLEKGFLDNSVALTSASTAHCRLISAAKFVERVQELRDKGRTSQGVLNALQLLCDLYCLHLVDASAGDLVAGEYFSPDHPALVRQQLLALLPQVRRIAVPLVDAFQFSDHFLNSSLGRFNGDVYTDLVSRATADPMNIPDVIDGYEEYLRPFITRRAARLIPLYSLAKLAGFAWLVLPNYHGAALIYDTFVHPFHVKALGRARVRKLKGKREREAEGSLEGRTAAGVSEGVWAAGAGNGGGMRAWGPEEKRVVESLDAPTRQAMAEFVNDNGLPAFVALLVEGNKQARKGRSPALGDDLETRLREKADLPTEERTSSGSKPYPDVVSGLSKRRAYNPSSEDTTVEGGSATTDEQRTNASS
ncbi:unnamed protein product [Closterium sp. Naga37s-1]|nr:unnamed protein product [Closterium sp. Naga37s-1]